MFFRELNAIGPAKRIIGNWPTTEFVARRDARSRSDYNLSMARVRKLFPIYGSALANNMFSALSRGRLVDHFVAAYVAEYGRQGILGGPSRDRELTETIGREAMLAMIQEVPRCCRDSSGSKNMQLSRTKKRRPWTLFPGADGGPWTRVEMER